MEEICIIFVISVLLLTYVKTDIFGSGKCMGLKIIWARHATVCSLCYTASINWLHIGNDFWYFSQPIFDVLNIYHKRYIELEKIYDK